MKYDIWQLPVNHKRKFRDYNEFNDRIDLGDYVHVYTGDIDDDKGLDDIYYILNVDHPLDYHAHSLSVSDIIGIKGKFYYVDGFGFVEVKLR